MEYDLIAIGSGPAGLMAAVTAAKNGARVMVLECLLSAGRKLLATGFGKCNLTNILPPEEMARRFRANPRLIRPALLAFPPEELRKWFHDRGVPTRVTDGFHVFPESERARDILVALLNETQRLGVEIRCNTPALELLQKDGAVTGVMTPDGPLHCRRLVLACGGNGYPELGGRGAGYRLAAQAGHSIVEPVPALVGLRTQEAWPGTLTGIVLPDAEVRFENETPDQGALLFTEHGLSGPAILDLSGAVNRKLLTEPEAVIRLQPDAGKDEAFWTNELNRCRQSEGQRPIANLIAGHFPRRFTETVIRLADCEGIPAARLDNNRRRRLLENLSNLPIVITGSEGWPKAMATSGGIPPNEINPRTLESRTLKHLHPAGEIINVNAPCGGYNLQWSFSTGHLAGSL